MAELYRAKITGVQGFEKLIAIKKILPHLISEEELVNSFVDEAKLAAFLQHQNIVQIYDFGCLEDNYFIAMEYLFGKDLNSIANKSKTTGQRITLENALHIISRICAGIDYAHKLKDFQGNPLNIIHRDIGPHNIFITYDGLVKIIDFGIAKAAIQNSTTERGLIKGKIAYMSPEQAEGKAIDHRSDVFSIGILLYEMATHKRMFTGDALQVFSLVRNADFEPPEMANKNLPPKLYEILHQALSKEPDKRYQSAAEMLSDLEECIYHLSYRLLERDLAQYMKDLFDEETDIEYRILQAAEQIDTKDDTSIDKEAPGQKEPDRTTSVMASDDLPSRKRRKIPGYTAVTIALVFLIIAVAFIFRKDSFSPISNKISGFINPFVQPGLSDNTMPSAAIKQGQPTIKNNSGKYSQGKQTITDNNRDESAKLNKAKEFLKKQQFSQAITVFTEILTEIPMMRDKVAKPYAEALYRLASKKINTDPEQARALLLRAKKLDAENAVGYYQFGRLYTKEKNYSEAIASYLKAADLDAMQPSTFYNLGYVYAKIKKYTLAEKMYKRSIELTPKFLDEALFNLAMIQNKLGKADNSIKNLKQALQTNPDNAQAKQYLQLLERKKGKTGNNQ